MLRQAQQPLRQAQTTDQRELTFMLWGLIPSWAKDSKIGSSLINARSETVAEKPSFRAAFKRRRCLVLADGFYEWQAINGKKQPMFIHMTEQRPFALAGLWESWHSPDGGVLDTCTILTTTPNELMAPIHNRMPVILEPEDYNTWLNPGDQPNIAMHLLRPFSSEKMAAYPVSTWVNSPAHDDAQCIVPLETNQKLLQRAQRYGKQQRKIFVSLSLCALCVNNLVWSIETVAANDC